MFESNKFYLSSILIEMKINLTKRVTHKNVILCKYKKDIKLYKN